MIFNNAKLGMFKTLLEKTGMPIGGSKKITEITELLAKHPKAVGETIGNLLGGKKKEAINIVNSLGGFDSLMNRLNKLAHQYPEAAIKFGVKASKRGFTVVKAEVTNGPKSIVKGAFSIIKKGENTQIKTRGKLFEHEGNFAKDINNNGEYSFVGGTQDLRYSGNGSKKTKSVTVNLGKKGEVGTVSVGKTSGNGKKLNVEQDENLVQVSAAGYGRSIDAVIDRSEIAKLKKPKNPTTPKSPSEERKPSTIKIPILRDLKERFFDSLNFFKFHKKDLGMVNKQEAQEMLNQLKAQKDKVAMEANATQRKDLIYRVQNLEQEIDDTRELLVLMG